MVLIVCSGGNQPVVINNLRGLEPIKIDDDDDDDDVVDMKMKDNARLLARGYKVMPQLRHSR